MAKNIDDQFINSYSRNFAEKIISNLPQDGSTISGRAIISLTPSKQVNFFILKLLYGQWQDEMKKLESPYFNYKHEEVKKALTTYMNVLSQHIEVAPEQLKPLVENSVKLTIHWVLFPGESLREEIAERNIRQVQTIKGIAKYFKIYQDDLAYLVSEKSDVHIDDFLEEWVQLMDQKSIDSTIEKELGFLNEVVEISVGDLIETDDSQEEEDELTVEVKDEAEESQEEFEEENEPESDMEEDSSEIPESSSEIVEEQLEESEEAEESQSVTDPATDDLVQETSEEEERVELDDSLNQKFAKSEETLHDQYKEEQVSVAAKHQQKKISSILEAVTVNQEYMFTTELFGGEKDLFLEAVEKIESCNSFDESVEILVSNYSKDFSWDMNSVEVKELLKVVFRRFR